MQQLYHKNLNKKTYFRRKYQYKKFLRKENNMFRKKDIKTRALIGIPIIFIVLIVGLIYKHNNEKKYYELQP